MRNSKREIKRWVYRIRHLPFHRNKCRAEYLHILGTLGSAWEMDNYSTFTFVKKRIKNYQFRYLWLQRLFVRRFE